MSEREIAVVSGASSGLGEVMARRLAAEGLHVVLVARRRDRLATLARELGHASVVACDLTEASATNQVRSAVEALDGPLVLLVNNAGRGARGTFVEGGTEAVTQAMEVNLTAHLRLTEALLPLLRAAASAGNRAGVVNVSSVAGRIARPGAGAYSATKFALAGWSESLRLEERQHGVAVSLMLPGFIATEGFPQRELLHHPIGRRLVASPQRAGDGVIRAWRTGAAEVYVPRPWRLVVLLKTVAPGLLDRLLARQEMTSSAK